MDGDGNLGGGRIEWDYIGKLYSFDIFVIRDGRY
jgi:hypothetical protein